MWGWLALTVVAVLAYKHFKGSSGGGLLSGVLSGGSAQAPTATPSGDSGVVQGGDQQGGTNDSWSQDAQNYLVGQGYTQSQASSAIGTYTSGGELSPTMATLVDAAVQGVGQPPQLILPTSTGPAGSTNSVATTTSSGSNRAVGTQPGYVTQNQSKYSKQGATPGQGGPTDTTGHRAYFQYKVKHGDTQASVASKFVSSAHQLSAWNNFKNVNQSLKPGQVIWV
jgi:LysM repeat protein